MEIEKEKENMQAQLVRAQKMEAVGTLAGGMAHDFNNLLTTIKGYTDLSLMNVPEGKTLHRNLSQIQKAVLRAGEITNQLLLFSRKQPTEPTTVNLNDTVNNILLLLEKLLGEDIKVHSDLESKLWRIWADTGNMEQMIMNLALNAKDAMPYGGTISIKTENIQLDKEQCMDIPESLPGKFVKLTFKDTGEGIAQDIIQHIFEPFFTTKEIGKGTGLGLSVIYGIIKQHEGWINVSSDPNGGAKFEIYLPASFIKKVGIRKREMKLEDFQGNGEKLLLVEDEEGIRELVSGVLQEYGYIVFKAENAKEALKIFKKNQGNIDLVFCDVVLPDINGLVLVEELLKQKPNLSVLLTSGYTGDKSQWPKIQKKGYRFLKKPFSLDELLRLIHKELFG